MNSQLSKRQRVSQNIMQFDGTIAPSAQQRMSRLNNILRLDDENALIGSVLQEQELFIQVSNQIQSGDFFNQLNGYIWYAFDTLSSRKEGIDQLNIADILDNEPKCPLKGNALLEYLSSLYSAPADRNNIESYARRVREAALKIRMLKALEAASDLVFEERDIDALIDGSNKLLFEATEQHRDEVTDAKSIVSGVWDSVEELMRKGASPTIPTGFETFDRLTTGATPGEVMILAGSEKQGKTTLLLSWIRNMCKAGRHVLLFTLEMSKAEIMRLLIAMESGIHRDILKTGQLNEKEFALFIEAAGKIQQWPLNIEDQYPTLSPIQARRQIRFHQAQHPVEVVAIDGLWLMDSNDTELNSNNRPRAVHEITRDLTMQAKLFNVPILITHQYKDLTGQLATRKAPGLYDLSESSGVRRNPQMIIGLHRAKEMVGGIEVDQTKLFILGDRNGSSTGESISLDYDKTYSNYKESASCSTNHPF